MEWAFNFVLSYPLWARWVMVACVCTLASTLLLAPRTKEADRKRAETSVSGQGIGSQTAGDGATFNNIFNNYGQFSPTGAIETPHLSFQKLAVFLVDAGQSTYQIGVVAKLFNLDQKPCLIKDISFRNISYDANPRGGYWIRRYIQTGTEVTHIEDNILRAGSDGYIKLLLPLKWELTLQGSAPDFVFFGDWEVRVGVTMVPLRPDFQSTAVSPISEADWNGLLKPGSSINVEALPYKSSPKRPDRTGAMSDYIVFNPDSTAKLDDLYGWSAVPPVRKQSVGVLGLIRGFGEPSLSSGWVILGHDYSEVWSDPERLRIYNAVYPPGPDGEPRKFGVFG